jgi:hypothetical protein
MLIKLYGQDPKEDASSARLWFIESLAETGMTISSPSIGPEAPVYKIGLMVTPPGGGTAYKAETTQAVPRLFVPMVLPGARLGVLVDPKDSAHVDVDWQRTGAGTAGAAGTAESMAAAILAGAGSGVGTVMQNPGGVTVVFDGQGNPVSGINEMVGAVRKGAMPTTSGSAAELLATGTPGTAVITTAQPLGKVVRDYNPKADADKLDDPMWLFTLEVTLPGHKPFPAMLGHRVPLLKVAQIAPGAKLEVAVDESNPSQDVAIDWDRSPIGAA